MDREETRSKELRRRRRCLVVSLLAALLLLSAVVALVLGLVLRNDPDQVKTKFIARCKAYEGYDCQKLWDAFEQAYVGQDPCQVFREAYDPFIAALSFKPACNKMMFWSKTKDVVHDFTKERGCFLTVEDTILGSLLDGLTWCGKEGSSETFTTDCPGWSDCANNPVRSYWNRASAAFADAACGKVTAMLNGSIDTPFSLFSIFGSIEVPRFNSSRVKSLNVVLVTQPNSVSNCTNESFKDLEKVLHKGIEYNCKEVAEARIEECSSSTQIACGACW